MGGGSSTEIGGVRVFKVNQGSPAAEAGLEVFFDFILEVNGVTMDPNYQQKFAEAIQAAENASAKLMVYNTRAHSTREVIVMPRKWAGTGLLGATVRYDVTEPSETHGIRVLEVFPNSPAAHAGLVPFQDYLMGTSQSVFRDIDELTEVVSTSINQRLQVYVYNVDSETVRELVLVANHDWGGEGCIGCELGTGLLHRIPAPRRPLGTAGVHGVPEPLQAMPMAPGMVPGVAVPPGYVPSGPPGATYPGVVAGTVVGGVPALAEATAPPVAAAPGAVAAPPAIGAPAGGAPAGAAAAAPAGAAPADRGIPPVPVAAPGQGGLPGISVGGAWNPSMMMGAAPSSAAAPAPASADAAAMDGAAKPQVGKLTAQWPPPPSAQPDAQEEAPSGAAPVTLPVSAAGAGQASLGEAASGSLPLGSPTMYNEGPMAPHATPIAGVPPPVMPDLAAAAGSAAQLEAPVPGAGQEQAVGAAPPNPGVALL